MKGTTTPYDTTEQIWLHKQRKRALARRSNKTQPTSTTTPKPPPPPPYYVLHPYMYTSTYKTISTFLRICTTSTTKPSVPPPVYGTTPYNTAPKPTRPGVVAEATTYGSGRKRRVVCYMRRPREISVEKSSAYLYGRNSAYEEEVSVEKKLSVILLITRPIIDMLNQEYHMFLPADIGAIKYITKTRQEAYEEVMRMEELVWRSSAYGKEAKRIMIIAPAYY